MHLSSKPKRAKSKPKVLTSYARSNTNRPKPPSPSQPQYQSNNQQQRQNQQSQQSHSQQSQRLDNIFHNQHHQQQRNQQPQQPQQPQQRQQQQYQQRPKRIQRQRLAKTGIVGAGPTGLTIARIAQVLGYQAPLTLIDKIAPARVDINNLKRNHPLLLTTSTIDALSFIDPKLYRRLLSLGRFDTFSGYLDWTDQPSKLLKPQEDPNNPFPRWVNHLCLPRDAYAFAVLTTPLFDLPPSYKELMRQAKDDPSIQLPPLPQVGINVGTIASITTPLQDPLYKQTFVPIVKLTPQAVIDAEVELVKLKNDVNRDLSNNNDDYYDGINTDENNNQNNNNSRQRQHVGNSIDDDHDDGDDNDDFYAQSTKKSGGNMSQLETESLRSRTTYQAREKLRQEKAEQIQQVKKSTEKLEKAMEFNMVIAADGMTSDLWKIQYKQDSNYSKLLASPNNNIRVHGWTRCSELKHMIGSTIGDVSFDSFDDAYRRVNSRIWTRRTNGIRFTSFLMDYAPLHLTDDMTYKPKEVTDLPEWIYWELLVAESIWKSQTNLPVPVLPATNNLPSIFAHGHNNNNNNNNHQQQSIQNNDNDEINNLIENMNDRRIEDGVMMFHGDPIKPIDLLQLGQLADHPLLKILVSRSEPAGLTVERSMYTSYENLRKSTFHDHVIYAGDAAFGSISDGFANDTLSYDHSIIIGLAMAANASKGPEFMARNVANIVDKTFFARAAQVQQHVISDSVYFGEPGLLNQKIATKLEKYFPSEEQSRQYERLYRFNPMKAYETSASEAVLDIFNRNKQQRDAVVQGFMDGQSRMVDFGDIPIDLFDLNFNPKMRESKSQYLPRK